MKVAIYGRVSTSDKDQNPETQLLPLREFAAAQGWVVFDEYIDQAPATDMVHRTAWRELLNDASRRRFDILLVWRMDRAFRSVLDAATTLERLRSRGIGLRSYSEPWLDTTSPFGEALYYITVAYAQLERGILRERVKAGMVRARKQGIKIGRPKVTDRRGFNKSFGDILARLSSGQISRSQAAKELGIGYATLKRLLDAPKRPGDIMKPANVKPTNQNDVLTSIHSKYTLSNTNEVDSLVIKNFLLTLAEISLAIASRKTKDKSSDEVNE